MKTVRLYEDDYHRLQKEANDCRLALAQFMAAYGNCDIPGALLNLAHKPDVPRGVSEHDACEAAMAAAWIRGAKALCITVKPRERKTTA
jgi:hypothetical protein